MVCAGMYNGRATQNFWILNLRRKVTMTSIGCTLLDLYSLQLDVVTLQSTSVASADPPTTRFCFDSNWPRAQRKMIAELFAAAVLQCRAIWERGCCPHWKPVGWSFLFSCWKFAWKHAWLHRAVRIVEWCGQWQRIYSALIACIFQTLTPYNDW